MVNDVSGADIFAGMQQRDGNIIASSVARQTKQLQYWKKCSGCSKHSEELGWITIGPAMSPRTAVEYTEYQNSKHSTPLPQYGQYNVGINNDSKYNLTDPERRYQALIELEGFKEFPLDQMIAYNWHRFPVLIKVRPELADVVDIKCEHGCANRLFTQLSHYQQHIQVVHKEVAQPEAIARQFRAAIESMNSNNTAMPSITEIATAVALALREVQNTPQVTPPAPIIAPKV